MFDGALGFLEVGFAFQVFAFIELFFSFAEGDFDFDESFFEVEASGYEGTTATLEGLFPCTDLAFVKEEAAGAVGIVIGVGTEVIFGDVGVVKDGDALFDADEGIADLRVATADGFDLGPGEDDAGLEGFLDKIVPVDSFVTNLLVACFVLGSGSRHGGKEIKTAALGSSRRGKDVEAPGSGRRQSVFLFLFAELVGDFALNDLAQGGILRGEAFEGLDQRFLSHLKLFNPAGNQIDE